MLKVVKKVTKEVSVYCCDLCGKESVRRSWLTGKIIWDKYGDSETCVTKTKTYWSVPGLLPKYKDRIDEFIICPNCFDYQLSDWIRSQKIKLTEKGQRKWLQNL